MAGSRTLKLSILADVDDLRKKLSSGEDSVSTFTDKLGNFATKAGAAFAVAGAAAAAYAGKLLVDGVKSAIEDEAAQAKLAASLEKVAGASAETVKEVEKYITQTSIAKGVTDDVLRPAFDRLVRSSGDVREAQRGLNIALDISAATGRNLEEVTNALGRAMDGSTTALGKLGLGFDAADLKGKTFADLAPLLEERFGGAAANAADTFAGKMDRLKIAFDEGKETVGSFVLDAITPLISGLVDKGIPAISDFADGLGTKLEPIFSKLFAFIKTDALPTLERWYRFLAEVVVPSIIKTVTPVINGLFSAFDKIKKAIQDNYESLEPLINGFKVFAKFIIAEVMPVLGKGLGAAFSALGSIISGLITGFAKVANAVESVVNGVRALIDLVRNNPVVKGISSLISNVFGGGKATGGAVTAGTTYLVGERGAELFTPSTSGTIIPNNRLGGGNTINLNVSGAIDPEGTARTIIEALNQSFARGTLGSLAFRS